MKKKTLLILVSVAFGLMIACKKKETKVDNATTPPPTTTGTVTPPVQPPVVESVAKVKTERSTVGSTTEQIEYTYDSKDRVVKRVYSSGYYVTLEWQDNKMIQSTYYSSTDILQSTITYNLNSQGRISDYTFQGILTSYEYNSEGFNTKVISSSSSMNISSNYQITDGNIMVVTSSNGGNTAYEYYADKLNTIGSVNKGLLAFGKQSKNLASKVTNSISSTSSSAEYTYEFDSKNRVVKMNQTNGSTTSYTEYTYY